jgi:F0F1-type ATP synthase assembly protein I
MAIPLSLVLVLGIAVWLLHKYAGLKPWHGVICVLFGFYLATSTLAPEIRTTVNAIINALTGHG